MLVHEKRRDFKCEKCEKAFVNIRELNAHVTAIHEGKKPFKCEICNVDFGYEKNLKNHIKFIHENKAAGVNILQKESKNKIGSFLGS